MTACALECNFAKLRQAWLRPVTQRLDMMNLGVITTDLTVNLKEIKPTSLAR
jgi:hypothetical protein